MATEIDESIIEAAQRCAMETDIPDFMKLDFENEEQMKAFFQWLDTHFGGEKNGN
jgi:hypothetical protein